MLNRFIQPDSIVPSPVEPQSWNKYSYTENNPIKYNDPSGHCGSSFTLTGMRDGTSGSGGVCLGQNSGNSGGSRNGLVINGGGSVTISSISPNSNNQSTPNSTIPSVIRLPEPTETPECNIVCDAPNLPNTTPPKAYNPTGIYIQILDLIFGYIEDINFSSPLFWRKTFTVAKAINPFPGIDAIVGGIGQGIEDTFNSDLSPNQRVQRVIVAGGESFITGAASNAIGVLVGLAGGGPYGYAGAQVVSSIIIDYYIWPEYNAEYFGAAGY